MRPFFDRELKTRAEEGHRDQDVAAHRPEGKDEDRVGTGMRRVGDGSAWTAVVMASGRWGPPPTPSRSGVYQNLVPRTAAIGEVCPHGELVVREAGRASLRRQT